MGQFSWLDCKTDEQVLDDVTRDVFVLVPKEFNDKYGERIKETCYDGYGRFGGYDIYDLIADWNKEFIPIMLEYIKAGKWTCPVDDKEKQDLLDFYEGKDVSDKRYLGIMMACYDDDNRKLFYPIKITYNKHATYEHCGPSLSDPDQGWKS